MSTILITGASGFIGSFLVEEGLKNGFTVYAGIRKSSSKSYLTDPRINFIEFDFSSQGKVEETLRDCDRKGIRFDFIIHNAGLTKARQKEEFYQVNCQTTINFIEALIKTSMIQKKIIQPITYGVKEMCQKVFGIDYLIMQNLYMKNIHHKNV